MLGFPVGDHGEQAVLAEPPPGRLGEPDRDGLAGGLGGRLDLRGELGSERDTEALDRHTAMLPPVLPAVEGSRQRG